MQSASIKELNTASTFAVVAAGERVAFSSLEVNAKYAAHGVPNAQVVECVLVPAALAPEGVILWGFFHNPCIHESAAALVSLHTSKASAWRTKHKAVFSTWMEAHRQCRERTPGHALDGKGRHWRRPEPDERFFIRAVFLKD